MAKKTIDISEDIIEIINPNDIKMIIDEATKKGQVAKYYKKHNVVIIGNDIKDISKKVYELDKLDK